MSCMEIIKMGGDKILLMFYPTSKGGAPLGGLVRLLPLTSPLFTLVVVWPGKELYNRFMFIEWFMMLPLVIVLMGLVLDRPCFSSSVVEKLCCGSVLLCVWLVMLSMAVLSGPDPWVLILESLPSAHHPCKGSDQPGSAGWIRDNLF